MRKLALLALLLVSTADAGPFRRRHAYYQQPQQFVTQTVPNQAVSSTGDESEDALDEVNAERARHGLVPFIKDRLLTRAAHTCARFRAERFMDGHTSNDFSALPDGASASAAGCAAWPVGMGWGACCTYDGYTYAGAAWVVGSDGKRYMHLFVR